MSATAKFHFRYMLKKAQIALGIFLFLVAAGFSLAQSQEPSPLDDASKNQAPQIQSGSPPFQPNAEKRGTEDAPFVIKVTQSPDRNEDAERKRKEEEHK